MNTSIYMLSFENGDKAEVEATCPEQAELLACQIAGQRAAAHCQFMRQPQLQDVKNGRPYAKYIPRN